MDSPIQKPLLTNGSRKRKRWSEEEIDNLYKGVIRFGVGNWKEILKHYNFHERNSIDLKDKWRNLEKNDPEFRTTLKNYKSIENESKYKSDNDSQIEEEPSTSNDED